MSPSRSLHPLTADPDKGLLEAGELAQLGQSDLVVAEHGLPLDLAQRVEPDRSSGRGRVCRGSTDLEPETHPPSRRPPPRWCQHSETGLFEDRSTVAEEFERTRRVGGLRDGHGGDQSGTDRGYEPRSTTQPTKKVLVRMLGVTFKSGELRTVFPDGLRGDEKARVVDRLKSELDLPVGGDLSSRVRATLLGLRGTSVCRPRRRVELCGSRCARTLIPCSRWRATRRVLPKELAARRRHRRPIRRETAAQRATLQPRPFS